jgi:hypothetical protein
MTNLRNALAIPFAEGTIRIEEYSAHRGWGPPPSKGDLRVVAHYDEGNDKVPLRLIEDIGVLAKNKGIDLPSVIPLHYQEYEELVLYLTGRIGYGAMRQSAYRFLETELGLTGFAAYPRIDGERFVFIRYTQWAPIVQLKELSWNLVSMLVEEREALQMRNPRYPLSEID